MSAPTATKGRIRNIYEGLYSWVIDALDDASYSNYYVSMNYKINVMNISGEPIATIRVDPGIYEDNAYGRIWQGGASPTTAMQTMFGFTIHVFSSYNTGIGEDHNRNAWIAARVIVDHLNSLSRTTDLSPRGVWAIDDIIMRESDPRVRNMGRIIIEGEIKVTREDSP